MRAVAVVSLHDITLQYSHTWSLRVPELGVWPGEILAVIGPNGSGKSSLLRLLGLLERPDTGEVRVHGRPVDPLRALAARRRIVTVFQESLLADTTVADNVALGLDFRGVRGDERRVRVARWLERFGIAGLAARRARTLSGGEAQRVALARALVLEPEVLLLDEPFAALDAPSRAALLPDLAAILRADRVTTVLVTHDRGEAQALADRVAVLLDGRLRQLDETARVFHAPASEDIARFVGVETIVTGRVASCEGGVTTVDVAGHHLEVAATAAVGETVRVGIRPEEVTLVASRDGAERSSARNALRGTVSRVIAASEGARVVIDCGFPLVATVTRRSVAELGLAEGVAVTAVFKASAAHLLTPWALLDTSTRPGL